MAGSSITFTEITHGTVKKIKAVWVSDDTTGAVSGTTTEAYSGRFLGLITDPGATAPSDNYTVTVTDDDTVDLLLGSATANRDTADTEFIKEADMAGVAMSKLTFNVSSAGNSKEGTIYLLLRGKFFRVFLPGFMSSPGERLAARVFFVIVFSAKGCVSRSSAIGLLRHHRWVPLGKNGRSGGPFISWSFDIS